MLSFNQHSTKTQNTQKFKKMKNFLILFSLLPFALAQRGAVCEFKDQVITG
jgi:hypothetical protein